MAYQLIRATQIEHAGNGCLAYRVIMVRRGVPFQPYVVWTETFSRHNKGYPVSRHGGIYCDYSHDAEIAFMNKRRKYELPEEYDKALLVMGEEIPAEVFTMVTAQEQA